MFIIPCNDPESKTECLPLEDQQEMTGIRTISPHCSVTRYVVLKMIANSYQQLLVHTCTGLRVHGHYNWIYFLLFSFNCY